MVQTGLIIVLNTTMIKIYIIQVTQRNLFFGALKINDLVIARITVSAFPL